MTLWGCKAELDEAASPRLINFFLCDPPKTNSTWPRCIWVSRWERARCMEVSLSCRGEHMFGDFPTQPSNNKTQTLSQTSSWTQATPPSFKTSWKYVSRKNPANQPVHGGKTETDSPKSTLYEFKLLDIFGSSHSVKFNGVCREPNGSTTWVTLKLRLVWLQPTQHLLNSYRLETNELWLAILCLNPRRTQTGGGDDDALHPKSSKTHLVELWDPNRSFCLIWSVEIKIR